jgi:hypothetical protein
MLVHKPVLSIYPNYILLFARKKPEVNVNTLLTVGRVPCRINKGAAVGIYWFDLVKSRGVPLELWLGPISSNFTGLAQ